MITKCQIRFDFDLDLKKKFLIAIQDQQGILKKKKKA